MVNVALPCVALLRAVEYPNMATSGACAFTWSAPGLLSTFTINPCRALRYPITSPRKSVGVSTSTAMIGSSRMGLALRQAASNAMAPAASKAMGVEVVW